MANSHARDRVNARHSPIWASEPASERTNERAYKWVDAFSNYNFYWHFSHTYYPKAIFCRDKCVARLWNEKKEKATFCATCVHRLHTQPNSIIDFMCSSFMLFPKKWRKQAASTRILTHSLTLSQKRHLFYPNFNKNTHQIKSTCTFEWYTMALGSA